MTLLLKDRLHVYMQLTRLDKPIGSLLLLWPTLWALWLAGAFYGLGYGTIYPLLNALAITASPPHRRA